MLDVKKSVERALANDVVVPVIGFFCNKGRRRSVAFGEVLARILGRAGCNVWVEHLAQDTWHRGACGGEGCRECTGPSTTREDALSKAWEFWTDIHV